MPLLPLLYQFLWTWSLHTAWLSPQLQGLTRQQLEGFDMAVLSAEAGLMKAMVPNHVIIGRIQLLPAHWPGDLYCFLAVDHKSPL